MKRNVIIVLLFALIAVGFVCNWHITHNDHTVTVTVTDKERIHDEYGGYYLIYTDNDVYKISDMWLRGVFNGSNMYSGLHKDSSYVLTVVGVRYPLLSSYEQIVKYRSVKK